MLTEVPESKLCVHKMFFVFSEILLTDRLWQLAKKQNEFKFLLLTLLLPAGNHNKGMIAHSATRCLHKHCSTRSFNQRVQHTLGCGKKKWRGEDEVSYLPTADQCQFRFYSRHHSCFKPELGDNACISTCVCHACCI